MQPYGHQVALVDPQFFLFFSKDHMWPNSPHVSIQPSGPHALNNLVALNFWCKCWKKNLMATKLVLVKCWEKGSIWQPPNYFLFFSDVLVVLTCDFCSLCETKVSSIASLVMPPLWKICGNCHEANIIISLTNN